ncbi:MAG: methyl-accepting chemotaxis protein, partial [Kangiellaceae bacterium]|nr:methyl-accepting chemotaxis protein [Kangiellaceae bacterium]
IDNKALLETARDNHFPALQLADSSLVQLGQIKDGLSSAITTGDKDELQANNSVADSFLDNLRKINSIDSTYQNEINPIIQNFNSYYSDAYQLSTEMIDDTVDFSSLGERTKRLNNNYDMAFSDLEKFSLRLNQTFKSAIQQANDDASWTITFGFIFGGVSIVILFAVAIPIAKSVKKNLLGVINSLRNIAQDNGDLTVRLHTHSQDEIGELVFWFNSFMEKLQGVIKDIVQSVLPLTSLVQSLNTISDETRHAIEQQFNEADDTKRTIDTMGERVVTIASNAAEAASAADRANSETKNGREVVQSTVDSIDQLSNDISRAAKVISQLDEDSKSVSIVLDVIKGIAEQTNLLALNAAIEAARAGEQGRGFAVVADEVRSLASRTQESTEEINRIIEKLQEAASSAVTAMQASSEQAKDSVESAARADLSLDSIAEAISSISSMNLEIANSTESQQSLSQDIIKKISGIQSRTEQTSNQSLKLGEASNDLSDMASKLESIAKQFKV